MTIFKRFRLIWMLTHDYLFHEVVNGFRNHNNHIVLTPISKVAKERIPVAHTEPTPNFPPKQGINADSMQTGLSCRRGSPTGLGYRLTLTLIKAVAQLVKNDFIPALGRQGLVGLPHRHLRCQGEEPSC